MIALKPVVVIPFVLFVLCACSILYLIFPHPCATHPHQTDPLLHRSPFSPPHSSQPPTPSTSLAPPPAPSDFKFAFFTYVASNNTKYIKWASLQALAAHTFNPDAEHNILVASTVGPRIPQALSAVGYKVVIEEPFPEAHQHGKTWVNQLTKIKLWARTDYHMVCHLDGDVIFFTNLTRALVDVCRPKLFDPAAGIDICGFENEECEMTEGSTFNGWNRNFWGMPYMEASIFCLRPSLPMYEHLVSTGVKQLQREKTVSIGNKTAHTEQDFLNLYFKDHIYYMPCKGGRAGGQILHTKAVEREWAARMEAGEEQSLQLFAPST